MPSSPHSISHHIFKRTPIAHGAVVAVSGIALLGWFTDHATLTTWLPAIANMTFNTALCFLLLAAAAIDATTLASRLGRPPQQQQRTRHIQRIIAAAVLIFATASLMQDMFHLDFGIDQLFIHTSGDHLTSPFPGRMSSVTAIGFILTSLTLISLAGQHQSPRRTNISHALILLLLLIGILGLAINFLQDIPPQYAHYASISTLTAINFLLLVWVLLNQLRLRSENLHAPLLHTGIQIMYRLKYPQKFLLISATFFIPLLLLASNAIERNQQQIDHAKLKMIGIQHIAETAQIAKAVPEHRGMLNAHLHNPQLFTRALQAKRREIDQLFAANDRMDRLHAKQINIPATWKKITSRWQRITHEPLDAITAWQYHTEIIQLLNQHIREVANQTRLAYDPVPQIHDLLDIHVNLLPTLLEAIGQLRGLGSGIIARHTISNTEKLDLNARISNIAMILQELSDRTATATSADPDAHRIADATARLVTLTQQFTSVVRHKLIDRDHPAITAQPYFNLGSAAIEQGHQLRAVTEQHLQHHLQQRIIDSLTNQTNIKLMLMVLLLLILFFFAAFYRSLMNTIQALKQAARHMKQSTSDPLTLPPIHDEMSDVVQSFHNISEALTQVNRNMEAVIEGAVYGIVSMDKAGIIQSCNSACEEIFGYTADELIGQNVTLLMPERFQQQHLEGLHRFLSTGQGRVLGHPMEVAGIRKDGEEFPLELSITNTEVNQQPLFIGMLRDTSAHHELENQLRHAQKMDAIGALVGGVAHNFNNLLAGIIGKVYLAKIKSKNNPELLPYFDSIDDISNQAADMVKQLLTFAHKDFLQDKQVTPFHILTKEAYKTAKLGIPENITTSLNICDEALNILCDSSQIQQIIMNMINNARDALEGCEKQQIDISLERFQPDIFFLRDHPELQSEHQTPATAYARLTIADSGQGMDEATIARIFEPFFTTKEVGKGTGLGLSTAFGSITAHGGAIDVESAPGQGTTFNIYLPLIEESAETSQRDHDHTIIASTQQETILLVDDEEIVIETTRDVLLSLGYQVITANHGRAGLEQFQQHEQAIDLILTDVVMPVMGGVEMVEQIRQHNADLPVIFATGYDSGNVQFKHEISNTTIISKPLQIGELSRTIHAALHPEEAAS